MISLQMYQRTLRGVQQRVGWIQTAFQRRIDGTRTKYGSGGDSMKRRNQTGVLGIGKVHGSPVQAGANRLVLQGLAAVQGSPPSPPNPPQKRGHIRVTNHFSLWM